MIDDQIHDAGPKGLSDEDHDHLRRQLLASIRAEQPTNAVRRRRTRHGLVAAVAVAAVLGTATAAAAYLALTHPDPKQAAKIIDHAQVVVDAHGPGWRPELNAELVDCDAAGEGVDFEAYASDGPLGGTVERAALVQACTDKSATLDQPGPEAVTLCVREGGEFARPVVLLGGTTCASADLGALDDNNLKALNEARVTEVAVLAIDEACPSRRQVFDWAESQLATHRSDLALVDSRAAGSPPQVCFGTYVDWIASTATVDITSYSD